MQSNIVIYFSDINPYGYPFTEPGYLDAYFNLSQKIERKGAKLFFVRGRQSYLGNGHFAEGWRFSANKKFLPIRSDIESHLIFNRQRGLGFFKKTDKAAILNHPDLDEICTDKWLTYKGFPSISPKTVLLEDLSTLKKSSSGKIILKPRFGDNCKGVKVVSIDDAKKHKTKIEYIAQEFLNLENGMPGICEWRHELRIFIANGVPKLAYINLIKDPKRMIVTAADESDCRKEVPIPSLPKKVLALIKKVDSKFKKFYPRLYSIDLGWDHKRKTPLLIELNSRPGLPNPKFRWYNKQLDLFTQAIYSGLNPKK